MADVTLEDLHGYLDEALSEKETARVEHAIRESSAVRQRLRGIMHERDRGEHTVGAIWRRHRLSCANREQLGSYLLGALEEEVQDYLRFHLEVIACSYCQANLADLQARHREPTRQVEHRHRKLFESSAGYLHIAAKKGRRGEER
jgi:hypothetical protein